MRTVSSTVLAAVDVEVGRSLAVLLLAAAGSPDAAAEEEEGDMVAVVVAVAASALAFCFCWSLSFGSSRSSAERWWWELFGLAVKLFAREWVELLRAEMEPPPLESLCLAEEAMWDGAERKLLTMALFERRCFSGLGLELVGGGPPPPPPPPPLLLLLLVSWGPGLSLGSGC